MPKSGDALLCQNDLYCIHQPQTSSSLLRADAYLPEYPVLGRVS